MKKFPFMGSPPLWFRDDRLFFIGVCAGPDAFEFRPAVFPDDINKMPGLILADGKFVRQDDLDRLFPGEAYPDELSGHETVFPVRKERLHLECGGLAVDRVVPERDLSFVRVDGAVLLQKRDPEAGSLAVLKPAAHFRRQITVADIEFDSHGVNIHELCKRPARSADIIPDVIGAEPDPAVERGGDLCVAQIQFRLGKLRLSAQKFCVAFLLRGACAVEFLWRRDFFTVKFGDTHEIEACIFRPRLCDAETGPAFFQGDFIGFLFDQVEQGSLFDIRPFDEVALFQKAADPRHQIDAFQRFRLCDHLAGRIVNSFCDGCGFHRQSQVGQIRCFRFFFTGCEQAQ